MTLIQNKKYKRKIARPEHRNTLTTGSYSHLRPEQFKYAWGKSDIAMLC